jgi:hypothetical protein
MISSRIRKYTAGSGTEQDKEFSKISRYSRNRKYSRIRNFSWNDGTGNEMLRYPTEMPDAGMPMSMGIAINADVQLKPES